MEGIQLMNWILLNEQTSAEFQPRRFRALGHLFQWSNPFRTLNYHGRRQPALLVMWTLLFIGYFPTMQTEQMDGQVDCATCSREKSMVLLKENEVRQWRIESTMQQILDRLEMEDRPPRVSKTKEDLQLLAPGTLLSNMQPSEGREETTEPARQIILFPVKIFRHRINLVHQRQHHHEKSETLKFHITDEMLDAVLQSAVLWTAQSSVDSNGTSEVTWQQTDVTEVVDNQLNLRHRHRLISLQLNGPTVPERNSGVALPKPYLIVQLDPSLRRSDGVQSRRKRSNMTPTCGPSVTQCCRDSLFVSFKDVGWDDWILAPSGFHAFYCRGSCRTFAAASSSASSHASLLQNLLSRNRAPAEVRPHLASCCAPTRLSPLTIFYSDEAGVIKQRSLPNMIVESCGCNL